MDLNDLFVMERYSELLKQVNILEESNIDKVKMLLENHSNETNSVFFVKIGKHTFGCQLRILKLYSPFFSAYQVGKTAEISTEKISPIIFHTIYDWLVSKTTLNIFTGKNVLDLLQAADYLHIPQLELSCYKFIDSLKEESALQLLIESQERNESLNVDLMLPRIQKAFLPFVGSEQFDELPADTMCTLLSSNFIAVHNEVEVFMSAIKWLMHDWEHRIHHVIRLMRCVRFGLMSAAELIEICRSEELDEVTGIPQVRMMLETGRLVVAMRCVHGQDHENMLRIMQNFAIEPPEERNWEGERHENSHYNDVFNQFKMSQKMKTNSIDVSVKSGQVKHHVTEEELRDGGPLRLPIGRHIYLTDRVEHLQNELSRLLYKILQQKREIRLKTREFQLQIKRDLQHALTSGNKKPIQGYLTLKAYYEILHLRRMQDILSQSLNNVAVAPVGEQESDILRLSEQLKSFEDMLKRSNEMMVHQSLPRNRKRLAEYHQATEEVGRYLQLLFNHTRQGDTSQAFNISLENCPLRLEGINDPGMILKRRGHPKEVLGIDHSQGDILQEKLFHGEDNEPVIRVSFEHVNDSAREEEYKWQLNNGRERQLLRRELTFLEINNELQRRRTRVQNGPAQQNLPVERHLRFQDMEVQMNILNRTLNSHVSLGTTSELNEAIIDGKDGNYDYSSQQQLSCIGEPNQSPTAFRKEYISSPEDFTQLPKECISSPEDFTPFPVYESCPQFTPVPSKEINPFMQEEPELISINEVCRKCHEWEARQRAECQGVFDSIADEKGINDCNTVELVGRTHIRPIPQWYEELTAIESGIPADMSMENEIKEDDASSSEQPLPSHYDKEHICWGHQIMSPEHELIPELSNEENPNQFHYELHRSDLDNYEYPMMEDYPYQEIQDDVSFLENNRLPSPILRTDQFDENRYTLSQRYEQFISCQWDQFDEDFSDQGTAERESSSEKQESSEDSQQSTEDLWFEQDDEVVVSEQDMSSKDITFNSQDNVTNRSLDSEVIEQAASISQSFVAYKSITSSKEVDDNEQLSTLKHELPVLRQRLARLEEKMNQFVALKHKKPKSRTTKQNEQNI